MTKYVNTSTHPVDLTGGRSVAPGETVDIKTLDDHAQGQIDSGLLIEVAEPSKGGDNKGGKD